MKLQQQITHFLKQEFVSIASIARLEWNKKK